MQTETGLSFKFGFVVNNASIARKNGVATETMLDLDGTQVSYEDIVDTASLDDRLILVLAPKVEIGNQMFQVDAEDSNIAIQVAKVKALDLKRHVDRFVSALAAEQRKQQLVQAGKGNLYRTMACPHCQATIDLSELDTPRIYCRYCSSILDRGQQVVSSGDIYRLCSDCGLFGRVRGYTVLYFYFLLVVYGYNYKRHHVCDSCAARIARRTLLINLVFLLGVPTAVHMWIKAVTGRDQVLKDLAKANRLARKGKYQEADPIYTRLIEQLPDHPGLLTNQAVGHLNGGDAAGGARVLMEALRACKNYSPALQLVQRLGQVMAAS